MGGFTKLVPEIIQSSIWNESPEVRCVWIALLALKDQNGYVRGDPQTLSRMANVPLESVQEAINKFTSPDPISHTPDNEGRRIEQAAGGWIVLNHELYRVGDRNEYMRQYMRKRRRSERGVNSVNVNNNNSSVSVSDPSASESVKGGGKGEGQQFEQFWDVYGKKQDKGHARTAFRSALKKTTLERMLAAIEEQKNTVKWTSGYQPNAATWLRGEQWENDAESMNVVAQSSHINRRYHK